MLGWMSKITPLTTRQLLDNTDPGRIKRSREQVVIKKVNQSFIIKKLSLWKRLSSFVTRNKVNTVFVKFEVTTKNKVNKKEYNVILVVPYLKGMSLKTLSNIPIKIFSTVPDLKYRFAYSLNKTNNLYTTEDIRDYLGIALTEPPKITNPSMVPMLDKHSYAVISRIDELKLTY